MSIGTIVTIVLLMTVLVLGLTLVRTIFSGAIENVNSIDQNVKSEINKLFAEDDNRRVIVYPPTKIISIKKGNDDYLGFALSIRNIDNTAREFDYEVVVNDPDIDDKCNIHGPEAESWIAAGKSGKVNILPSSSMEEPEFVRFLIPSDAPSCLIRYTVLVDNGDYTSISMDLKVEAS